MSKRAVDLSLEELAAMGANAALKSAQQAYGAGLAVVGTVDVVHADRVVSTARTTKPVGRDHAAQRDGSHGSRRPPGGGVGDKKASR